MHVEENAIDSSSSSLPQPTKGEIQRSSQINEISESGKRKSKSKVWSHFKPVMFNGFRFGISK
ncbi:hypothetical protein P3S68_003519 [Capsicum galapagoense]